MRKFGVHSEVGKLSTVLVRCPGLPQQRLTPVTVSSKESGIV